MDNLIKIILIVIVVFTLFGCSISCKKLEKFTEQVNCGGHRANSCSECPFDGDTHKGKNWCNGDCYWNDGKSVNRGKAEENKKQPGCLLKKINCGGHRAKNYCSECPFYKNKYKGKNYCNGDCQWNDIFEVKRETAEIWNDQPACRKKLTPEEIEENNKICEYGDYNC